MCAEMDSSLKQQTLKGNGVIWETVGQNLQVMMMPPKGCDHQYFAIGCEECSNERRLMGRLMIMK